MKAHTSQSGKLLCLCQVPIKYAAHAYGNQCDHIWRNFVTLVNFLTNFFKLISFLAKLRHILVIFCYWANFHWCKWQNFAKTIVASGHTESRPTRRRRRLKRFSSSSSLLKSSTWKHSFFLFFWLKSLFDARTMWLEEREGFCQDQLGRFYPEYVDGELPTR